MIHRLIMCGGSNDKPVDEAMPRVHSPGLLRSPRRDRCSSATTTGEPSMEELDQRESMAVESAHGRKGAERR